MPWIQHPNDPNSATFEDYTLEAPECQHAYDPEGETTWPMTWHATRVRFTLDDDRGLDEVEGEGFDALLDTRAEFNCTPVTLTGLPGSWIVYALPAV
jgi:hypothetical protein